MYRETIIAASLASALDELRSPLGLTEDQVDQIWSIFDRTMDETLNDVPTDCDMTIHTSPPVRGNAAPSIPIPSHESPASSSGEARTTDAPTVGVAAPSLEFPLYRIQDGVWTVILKDPVVTIRTAKRTETIALDYMKCYLKDNTERNVRRSKRPRN